MWNFRHLDGLHCGRIMNRLAAKPRLFYFWILFAVCGRCLAEHCHQNELQHCMEHVKPIMQNVTIGFAANAEQLNTVCNLFNQGMECIDRFVLRCFIESQRILFRESMAGVEEVMRRLCTDGEYRKEYLRHADCFRSVAPQYEECGGAFRTSVGTINQNRATETQDKLSQMCGALHRFLECAYGLTSQHCGDKGKSASEFLRTYTEKAVGSLITSTCRKFPSGNSRLSSLDNRVHEIDEADGLREVSVQQELTTMLITSTATRAPRPRKGSKKGNNQRSKATTPLSAAKSTDKSHKSISPQTADQRGSSIRVSFSLRLISIQSILLCFFFLCWPS